MRPAMTRLLPSLVLALLATAAGAQDVPPAAPSPAPPASPAPPEPPGPKVSWKDGKTTVEFAKALVTVGTRAQFRWTGEYPDETVQLPGTDAPGESLGSFRVRRVKTKVEGWIYSPRLSYELQVNWPDLGATPGNAL